MLAAALGSGLLLAAPAAHPPPVRVTYEVVVTSGGWSADVLRDPHRCLAEAVGDDSYLAVPTIEAAELCAQAAAALSRGR